MLKLEQVALELLEYKIEDLKAARLVKGGLVSIWNLYNHLFKEAAVLSETERSRVDAAGVVLKRFGETSKTPHPRSPTLESLVLEDFAASAGARAGFTATLTEETPILEMDPEVLEEQAVLQRLAKRVWWSDMDAVVHELAVQCRAEKDRLTARLLYALSHNLSHYLATTQTGSDGTPNRFQVVGPVPERGDPLVALNDLDILSDLVRDLVEILMGISDGTGRYASLGLPRGQALGFVKRMALAIARHPYGGERSPVAPRGPSSDQLRLALQELAKEPLREEQRQQQRAVLTERLRITTAFEKQQRDTFQQDVQGFSNAAHSFFSRLERHLPERAGGAAGEPHLRGGVLFAVNPALRAESVAADATSATVHLKGPTRLVLAGLELAVSGGRTPSLYLNGQDHLLQPRLRLTFDNTTVVAIHEGAYLHLKVRDEARSLAALTAEALAVYTVLSSPYRAEVLRVLRIATNVATGEPQDLVTQALHRLRELSGRAPERHRALTGLLHGAARAVGITLPDPVVETLVHRFSSAITVAADDLDAVLAAADGAAVGVYRLKGKPLALNVAGQLLTVREYRNRANDAQTSLAVTLPNCTVGSFKTYLVRPIPGGTLLCIRAGEDLACLYFDGVALDA